MLGLGCVCCSRNTFRFVRGGCDFSSLGSTFALRLEAVEKHK